MTTCARRGHSFASRCDTEILPHLYEEYGPMFPEQLRGMFGIAVWDQVRRRGVIARDRLGIKPIYYAVCGDSLVFASELKSLLASGLVPSDLDYEAIDAFLSLGFFPAPATPLAAVKKLEPGCILVIDERRGRGAAVLELSGADARTGRKRRGRGASACWPSWRSPCACG